MVISDIIKNRKAIESAEIIARRKAIKDFVKREILLNRIIYGYSRKVRYTWD